MASIYAHCDCGWQSAPYDITEQHCGADVLGALNNHLTHDCDRPCLCAWGDNPRIPEVIEPRCALHGGDPRIGPSITYVDPTLVTK